MATLIHSPVRLCLYSIPLPFPFLQSERYLHSNRLLQPVVSIATARGPEGGKKMESHEKSAESLQWGLKTMRVPAC